MGRLPHLTGNHRNSIVHQFRPNGTPIQLMTLRSLLNKTIILGVFVLAGFLLARSLYYQSLIGVICAIVAIAAWANFLYRLQKHQEEDKVLNELCDDQ